MKKTPEMEKRDNNLAESGYENRLQRFITIS